MATRRGRGLLPFVQRWRGRVVRGERCRSAEEEASRQRGGEQTRSFHNRPYPRLRSVGSRCFLPALRDATSSGTPPRPAQTASTSGSGHSIHPPMNPPQGILRPVVAVLLLGLGAAASGEELHSFKKV